MVKIDTSYINALWYRGWNKNEWMNEWILAVTNSVIRANKFQWTAYSSTIHRSYAVWKLSSGMVCHVMTISVHNNWVHTNAWENQQCMQKSSLHLGAYTWTRLSALVSFLACLTLTSRWLSYIPPICLAICELHSAYSSQSLLWDDLIFL